MNVSPSDQDTGCPPHCCCEAPVCCDCGEPVQRMNGDDGPHCDDCELPVAICACERCEACGSEDEADNLLCDGCGCCQSCCNCTETDCDCEACVPRREGEAA